MNPILLNICFGIAFTLAGFGVRALIATAKTKDYFDKHVREAERLGFGERRVPIREGLVLNVAEGPAGGAPLLLIPGQGCVWQEYAKALPALAGEFHVFVIDVHGHGESTWNPDDYTAVRIADDLAALIERMVGGPAIIAGHSSGGLVASLVAANRPDLVRGVVFEDCPFFATEPDRVERTYIYIDVFRNVLTFLDQDAERDWVCWYMPRSYWKRWFGPVWTLLTRSVIRQRRARPDRMPIVRWVGIGINRIWGTMSQPYDPRFGVGFTDNAWFVGFDQADTLARVTCPTVFVKATTRHDRQGNLLAALSDEDLTRVEALLPDNETVRVRSSHDVHFARTDDYVGVLRAFAERIRAGAAPESRPRGGRGGR